MREDLPYNYNIIESPPHDAIWTIDRILAKPPQAPPRSLQKVKSQQTSHSFDQLYYDVRNQEDNFEDDEDEYRSDEEMDTMYRVILPSRKLFADEDDETEAMYDFEDIIRDVAFPPIALDEHPICQPSVLLLPTLVPEESKRFKSNSGGFDQSNHHVLHEQQPVRRRVGPIVVEEDDETCNSDDNSLFCYSEEFIPSHASGTRENQIFRRVENTEYNDENSDVFRSSPFVNNNNYNSSPHYTRSSFHFLSDTGCDFDMNINNTHQLEDSNQNDL